MCRCVIPWFYTLIRISQVEAHRGLNKMEISLGADSLRFNYSVTNHRQMFLNYLA